MPDAQQPDPGDSFSVIRELGRGGMGVVHLVRDCTLDREVAIKTLPADFSSDPERLPRFEREARLLASLSHGNIAAIHGLDVSGGTRRLIMEFVPGQTLSATLAEGPLAIEAALRINAQVAAAIEAAHDAGVIHRDLKPGNTIIRPDGIAKVLDFGLARIATQRGPDSSSLPTITNVAESITTHHGVMGTPGYMSPEQARGKPLDKRTDIFSFGCVLYESLAGGPAFASETATDAIVAVIESEPDLERLHPRTPSRIRELIRHCLEKDPARRLRDIGDARLEIERSIAGQEWSRSSMVGQTPAMKARRRWRAALPWTLAFVAIALAVVLSVRKKPTPATESVALSILAEPGHHTTSALISPDGRTIAYWGVPDEGNATVGRGWRIRSLGEFTSRLLPGTHRAFSASFSPDGQWLVSCERNPASPDTWTIHKSSILSPAPPVAIATFKATDVPIPPLWHPGGQILLPALIGDRPTMLGFSESGGPPQIIEVDAGSSDIELGLTVYPESMSLVPGDPHRIFITLARFSANQSRFDIFVYDTRTSAITLVHENGGHPRLIGDDRLLFTRGDALLVAPFDRRRFRVAGSPRIALTGLRAPSFYQNAQYDLARNNSLVYIPGGLTGGSRSFAIIEPDGSGTIIPHPPLPLVRNAFDVSPDGQRLATISNLPRAGNELLLMDLGRPNFRRLTTAPDTFSALPAWSPCGRILYFVEASVGAGNMPRHRIVAMDAESGGPAKSIYEPPSGSPAVFSAICPMPDGSALLATMYDFEAGLNSIIHIPLGGHDPGEHGGIRTLISSTGSGYPNLAISSDGAMLAYNALEGMYYETFVSRINQNATLGPAIPITSGGSWGPIWRDRSAGQPTGEHELIYNSISSQLTSVIITSQPRITIGTPTILPCDPPRMRGYARPLPDGRLLRIIGDEDESTPKEIRIITNIANMLR